MLKVQSGRLTAGMLSRNFMEAVKSFDDDSSGLRTGKKKIIIRLNFLSEYFSEIIIT